MKVSHTLTVRAPVERAFAVFTDGFGSWWPATHHLGDSELADAIIEPRAGGRWYERDVDGSECEWGTVVAFEPPHRLVLTWQIGGDWCYHADQASEIEVNFTPTGDQTHVTLEHRLLERHGEGAASLRDAVSQEGGWSGLLVLYRDALASRSSAAELMQ